MTAVCTAVLVAGGGPAGLAAAIALAERGLRALVAELRATEVTSRAEMLPPAAGPVLARLGIAEIVERSVSLGPALSLWEGERPETRDHGMGLHPPAISIDRRDLDRQLRARAAALGVEIKALRVKRVAGCAGDWRVTLSGAGGGEDVRARFLLDATGRAAQVARRLGARLHFGQPLVARTWQVPPACYPRLVVEATPSGWWYALPLTNGGGTLGFVSSPNAEVASPTLLASPPEGMAPACWDARMARLVPLAGDGWLAAGDAAAAFDPIASQGLFTALSGGFFAGNAAADALSGNADAPLVFANLIARTAARTHRATPLQYAFARQDSPFWRRMGRNASTVTPAAFRAAEQQRATSRRG